MYLNAFIDLNSKHKNIGLIRSMSITQWSYIGPKFWNDNGPILAASRWFTDGQWLVKCWILHLANIIPTT